MNAFSVAFGGKADVRGRFFCLLVWFTFGGVILFQWLTVVCKNNIAALFHVKHYSSKALS
jgi:hypothetical protein